MLTAILVGLVVYGIVSIGVTLALYGWLGSRADGS